MIWLDCFLKIRKVALMRTVSSVLFALSVLSNPWALGQQPKPSCPIQS